MKENRLIRRLAVTALTVAISSSVATVPSAVAATDYGALIEAHNQRFMKWFRVYSRVRSNSLWNNTFGIGMFTRPYTASFYGCPEGTWRFSRLDNADADNHRGVGGLDRTMAAIEGNAQECRDSLAAIRAAAEKDVWSPAMEVLEDGPKALVASTQNDNGSAHLRKAAVSPSIVKAKRAEFIDMIALSDWSTKTERMAKTVRPYADAAEVDEALQTSRKDTLNALASDNSEWSAAWAARFTEIATVLPKETAAVLDARFDRLLNTFRTDGKAWSPEWENSVVRATVGATAAQKKRADAVISARRQQEADRFVNDGQPWSPEWEKSLTTFRNIDVARADKVIADRRLAAAKAVERDGQSWTPEWDKRIAPLAGVSAEAKQIRSDRRAGYVREVTSNQAWNEVADRVFQGFLEDNTTRRVPLDASTVSLIDTWRARNVDGLASNRVWSPELEEEFAYLQVTYPKAKEQIAKLREQAASKATADIEENGWNAEADAQLAALAKFQYTPYGQQLDDVRKAGLAQLREASWSPDVDSRLNKLAEVYPIARDAVAQERGEAFEAVSLPEQWNEDVDGQLAPLAEVGYTPAINALEALRSDYLVRLENAEPTAERDIELAKLADVYAPARDVVDSGTLEPAPVESPEVPAGEGGSDDGTDNGGDKPGADVYAPGAPGVDGGQDLDDDDPDADGSSGDEMSSDEDGEVSPEKVREVIGIVVAVMGAVGAGLGLLAPILERFNIPVGDLSRLSGLANSLPRL